MPVDELVGCSGEMKKKEKTDYCFSYLLFSEA